MKKLSESMIRALRYYRIFCDLRAEGGTFVRDSTDLALRKRGLIADAGRPHIGYRITDAGRKYLAEEVE